MNLPLMFCYVMFSALEYRGYMKKQAYLGQRLVCQRYLSKVEIRRLLG
jgi:hypothetical protein